MTAPQPHSRATVDECRPEKRDGQGDKQLQPARGPEAQAVAKGETVTDCYTDRIRDTHGATAGATLTVTIVGTSDQPVVDVVHTSATATFSEPSENLAHASDSHHVGATIAFNDVD